MVEMRCLVRGSREQAVRAWSPNLISILARPTAEQWLNERGIDYDINPLKPKIQESYDTLKTMYADVQHVEDWETAEDLADVIPFELQAAMGDTMAVLGDPDQVAAQMMKLGAIGVEHIYMYAVETFWFPEPERQAFQDVIAKTLASAS